MILKNQDHIQIHCHYREDIRNFKGKAQYLLQFNEIKLHHSKSNATTNQQKCSIPLKNETCKKLYSNLFAQIVTDLAISLQLPHSLGINEGFLIIRIT